MNVKEEMSSKEPESREEFIPDIPSTRTPSIYHLVTDIPEIKQEEVGFCNNSRDDSQDSPHLDHETAPNIQHVDFNCASVKADENEFYLDLLQCERGCVTCEKYMRLLCEHVRATHVAPQPFQDPLLIDPLSIDPDPPQAPSNQANPEVEENIERMECSEEESTSMCDSESDPDFELESESDSDPDYNARTPLSPNVRPQRSVKNQFQKSFRESHLLTQNTQHKINHSREDFKCDECGKSFKKSDLLILHKRVHSGDRPFKCEQCEKSFTQLRYLNEHKRIHSTEKTFKCRECGKCFQKYTALTKHKGIHTGKTLYECDECEMSFTRSDMFWFHKRIHTEQKPFKCNECKESFETSDLLMEHRQIHTGEFKKSDLKRHTKIHK